MKTYVFCFLLICLPLLLLAQQDIALPGVVVEQNSAYRTGEVKYLSNASVSAAGAGATTSDAAGRFRLVFADKPYGNVARLYVRKQDYEVVNTRVIEHATVLGRTAPLKVVMCPAGQLYENQVRYYAIARDEAIKNYERRVAMLEKGGAEKEQLLRELRLQYDQEVESNAAAKALLLEEKEIIEGQLRLLADKWVTVNLDDQSPTYQRAFRAFESGDTELALQTMDSINLEERLRFNKAQGEKESRNITELQERLYYRKVQSEQDVQACILMARLYVLKFEWDRVAYYYDLALEFDEQNLAVIEEAALFYIRQNNNSKARNLYKEGLQQAKGVLSRAAFFYMIGSLLSEEEDFYEAVESYQKALKLYRALALKQPDTFLPDVAMVLNNIGLVHFSQKDLGTAKTFYQESLDIMMQVAKKSPEIAVVHYAGLLVNMGMLEKEQQEHTSALVKFEKALVVFRRCEQEVPNAFLTSIALTLNNIGLLYCDLKDYQEALVSLNEALDIYIRLDKLHPGSQSSTIAFSYTNIGIVEYCLNEPARAILSFQQALALYKSLIEGHSVSYMPDIANVYVNLGIAFLSLQRLREAEDNFNKALDIFRSLAEKQPEAFLSDFARTKINIGAVHYVKQEWELAINSYREALDILEEDGFEHSKAFMDEVAIAYNNVGLMHWGREEFDEAEQAYNKALDLLFSLVQAELGVYDDDLARTLNNLGLLQSSQSKLQEAIVSHREAIGIQRLLYKDQPEAFRVDLAKSLIGLSFAYLFSLEQKWNSGECFTKCVRAVVSCSVVELLAEHLKSELSLSRLAHFGPLAWPLLGQGRLYLCCQLNDMALHSLLHPIAKQQV